MSRALIKGVAVELGAERFIIPALNLDQLEAFEADIALVRSYDPHDPYNKERMGAIVRVVHAALTRNYPEVTADSVRRGLDLNNIGEIADAVFGLSGLEKRTGDAPPGEVQSRSTGTGSKPASLPAPAGPGSTSESS